MRYAKRAKYHKTSRNTPKQTDRKQCGIAFFYPRLKITTKLRKTQKQHSQKNAKQKKPTTNTKIQKKKNFKKIKTIK